MTHPLMHVAQRAARAGGQALLDRLEAARDVRSKGFRDIVTDADLAAQEAVLTIIRQHCPTHDVLSEESPPNAGVGDELWVVDPLDGTINYAHRFPCFCVSVALVVQGEPAMGVVFDPLHERLFAAERGGGATLNGQPVHVSACADLAAAMVGLDWARHPAMRQRVVASLTGVAESATTLRSVGSAALGLCYVAAGWLDAYFNFALQPWDGAAAGLIVREAGGALSAPSGAAWAYTAPACVASNGLIHAAVLRHMAHDE